MSDGQTNAGATSSPDNVGAESGPVYIQHETVVAGEGTEENTQADGPVLIEHAPVVAGEGTEENRQADEPVIIQHAPVVVEEPTTAPVSDEEAHQPNVVPVIIQHDSVVVDDSIPDVDHKFRPETPEPAVIQHETVVFDDSVKPTINGVKLPENSGKDPEKDDLEDDGPERAVWGNQIEFLMSCIATSVGLGNVWRFPFAAYENGGGAFLIPYIIVLFLIGKPMYYLECALGQFSSRNSIKVWAMVPAMKGAGYALTIGCGSILSYYVSIIALCLFYLIMSFQKVLPWAVCKDEWGDVCVPSAPNSSVSTQTVVNAVSSAELYFTQTVLKQPDGIHDGIGTPIWYLTLCLLGSWLIIFVIVAQGVKSSGKAAYFLALFPYVVMLILLVRAVTLEGAKDGILFFFTPQWDALYKLEVWYAAVTQVFFSLSVGVGSIIMFSSYNGFRQNIYRDAMIVTTLDTFTSLMSGITIFAILGNLAFELGYDDIDKVVQSGTGLAFVSYPDAIAKSPFAPQLFSVLFFLMMSVLGVGSAVALLSTISTVLRDSFPRVPTILMSAICCSVGFLIGLIYVTPGGQYVLGIVDFYGGTFLVLSAAIGEIIAVFWIYGLESLCLDIEFMLNIKTSIYWRFCWGLITPIMMIIVFIYALLTFKVPLFNDVYRYPDTAYALGYTLLFTGILLIPIFMANAFYKNRSGDCTKTIVKSFSSKESWGPSSKKLKREWLSFKEQAKFDMESKNASKMQHFWYILTGKYRKNL